jgi:outer membrane immunogenic protein
VGKKLGALKKLPAPESPRNGNHLEALTYINGGYTSTRFDDTQILSPQFPCAGCLTGAVLHGQTFNGWFFGGGTEIAIPWVPGLFWRSEYRYAKYNSRNSPEVCQFVPGGAQSAACGAVGPTGVVDRQSPAVQTIYSVLVYRFNWWR